MASSASSLTSDLPVAHSPPPTTLAVLISGGGTNLQALIDACASKLLPSTSIIRVISNRQNAYGLKRAANAAIPTTYHNLIAGRYHEKGERDPVKIKEAREKYDGDLAELVLKDKPDIVVCAGWMHILAPSFLDPLASAKVPVINLHPALPGRYDGAGAIERAYKDWQDGNLEDSTTGVMVHYVISEVDRGQPILVREIRILDGESLEELIERIHGVDHDIIVKGVGLATVNLWEERNSSGTGLVA